VMAAFGFVFPEAFVFAALSATARQAGSRFFACFGKGNMVRVTAIAARQVVHPQVKAPVP
jgi:hypothetical protein